MGELDKKNILIRSTKEKLDIFKRIGFEFYEKNNIIHLFSFKNFLIVILCNLEKNYKKKYGSVLTVSDDYMMFYKRKGRSIIQKVDKESKENINFNLDADHYDMFYNMMHTYFINNGKNQFSNYSASLYFNEIVDYIINNKLSVIDKIQ